MVFFRLNIESMSAYVPGAQPADLRRVVKLNQNENPFPPSPQVERVLRSFDASSLRFYPDPMAGEFCQVAAEVLAVPADWICVGDGSDDLIMMIARAAAGPDCPIAQPAPTFPFYFTQAQIEDAPLIDVECGEDFALPIEELATTNAAVTFLSSPNSPTGATAEVDQLDWLARQLKGLLVLDEAYADFAEDTALPLVKRHDNVIILRTLSKGYSLAGLRLGFGIMNPELLAGLLKTKSIYNVGALPAAIGAAAMADQGYHSACVGAIKGQRQRLADALQARGFTVWASQGNFLMVRPPAGDAEAVCERLRQRDVLVRYFRKGRMRDKLRISVGTEADNDALLAALDAE